MSLLPQDQIKFILLRQPMCDSRRSILSGVISQQATWDNTISIQGGSGLYLYPLYQKKKKEEAVSSVFLRKFGLVLVIICVL